MYILDTNVISELRKSSGRVNANVLAWSQQVHPMDLYLSVITLQEIETGILLLNRRDAEQASRLRHWLETTVRPAFQKRLLPVTDEIALRCAPFHVPDPAPYADSLIAATALVHNFTVVTRNTAHFTKCGAPNINPWLTSSV